METYIMIWDNFANEPVMEKDRYAPPERYTTLLRGTQDHIIVDTYYNGNQFLDFAYSDFEHLEAIYYERKAHFEKYNFKPMYLDHQLIPAERFDKTVKHYGYKLEDFLIKEG